MSAMQGNAPVTELLETETGRAWGRNEVVPRLEAPRKTRVVCMGGGTGLPVVLKGLVRRAEPTLDDPGVDITAVVAMSDDGGSSGRLRRTRGILPPGDVRNCLVALSGNNKSAMGEIFQFRFGGRKGIAGHAVGNLLIAALAELKGDFLEAVEVAGRMLEAKGRVLPSTTEAVQLQATLKDGRQILGERAIAKARQPIARVSLSPRLPPASPGLLEAIAHADVVTIGPGSLYSSVLPNLLVDGVADALRKTRALKVLVTNLMTQPGETDGMMCADHVKAVLDHAGPVVDVVLVNAAPLPAELLRWYGSRGGVPVRAERGALLDLGVIPVEADLVKQGTKRIRHDSRKVARCVLKLARMGL